MSATNRCMLHAAMSRARVMQHLVHGDRQSVLVTQHGLGQRIADQDNVDTGLVHQARAGVVVGSETSNRFVVEFFSRREAR